MKINELEEKIKILFQKDKNQSEKLNTLQEKKSNINTYIENVIVKEKLGKLYSTEREVLEENEEKIIKRLISMDDDEKLVIGNFLYKNGLLEFCLGFGGYKSSSDCTYCINGEKNVKLLGLQKYVKYVTGRDHILPKKVVEQAQNNLNKSNIPEKLENKITKTQMLLDNLDNQRKDLISLVNVFKKLESQGIDYEKVEENMPEFIQKAQDNEGSTYITAIPEERIGIILKNKSSYYGSGGMEYGINVIVSRDGEIDTQYFKWRDASSADRDKPWLNFDKAKIINILDKGFDVELNSGKRITKRHYDLKKKRIEMKANLL